AGELGSWEASALEALALVIVLDQFPRNIHRGSHLAFANDAEARAVARRAIARGFDVALPRTRQFFFYLPVEPSGDAADQDRAVQKPTPRSRSHHTPKPTPQPRLCPGCRDRGHRPHVRRGSRLPHSAYAPSALAHPPPPRRAWRRSFTSGTASGRYPRDCTAV